MTSLQKQTNKENKQMRISIMFITIEEKIWPLEVTLWNQSIIL